MSETQLRAEIESIRQNGCMKAGEHTEAVNTLKQGHVQHDKRIVATERDVSGLTQKIETMPDAISATVVKEVVKELTTNGNMKPIRTMVPLKVFGVIDTKVPATWIGWFLVILALAATVFFHGSKAEKTRALFEEVRPIITVMKQQMATNSVSP